MVTKEKTVYVLAGAFAMTIGVLLLFLSHQFLDQSKEFVRVLSLAVAILTPISIIGRLKTLASTMLTWGFRLANGTKKNGVNRAE